MTRLQDITRSLDPEQTTGGVTYKSCRISVKGIRMTGSGFICGSQRGGCSPHPNPLPEGGGPLRPLRPLESTSRLFSEGIGELQRQTPVSAGLNDLGQ